MKRIAFLLLFVVLAACSSRPVPRGIIVPDQMQTIIFDLLKADEFINGFAIRDTAHNIEVTRKKLYEQVFAIHHTTKEDFYKSYTYYEQHPQKHKLVLDTLYATLTRKKAEAEKPKIMKPATVKPK